MPTGRKSLAALPFAFPHLSRPPRLERVNDGDWSDSDSDVEDVLFHAGERLVWRQYPNGRAAESHDQHPRACKEWCCDKDSDDSQGAVLQTSPPRSSTDESNDSRNFWDHAARVLGKAGMGPASPSVARRQFQRHVGKENCPPKPPKQKPGTPAPGSPSARPSLSRRLRRRRHSVSARSMPRCPTAARECTLLVRRWLSIITPSDLSWLDASWLNAIAAFLFMLAHSTFLVGA